MLKPSDLLPPPREKRIEICPPNLQDFLLNHQGFCPRFQQIYTEEDRYLQFTKHGIKGLQTVDWESISKLDHLSNRYRFTCHLQVSSYYYNLIQARSQRLFLGGQGQNLGEQYFLLIVAITYGLKLIIFLLLTVVCRSFAFAFLSLWKFWVRLKSGSYWGSGGVVPSARRFLRKQINFRPI